VNILGIETSCDETAAAVVRDGKEILSNVVASQQRLHEQYGGVVPEVACRAHIEAITPVIEQAMAQAGLAYGDLDAIAVTQAPGLVGALLIGISAAKALAWRFRLPLIAVNHVEAHVYASVLEGQVPEYPAVALIVSGGHTLLLRCPSTTSFEWIGSTTDDAVGEAFDKVASVLGLGYPGGPVVDRRAAQGNPRAIPFPRTYLDPERFDFSFSGIKTAVLYHVRGQDAAGRKSPGPLADSEVADIAASFQEAVVEVLAEKTFRAADRYQARCVIVGGGVACNRRLRSLFLAHSARRGIPLILPSPKFCTDNAAMVAGLACPLFHEGRLASLSFDARPTLIRSSITSH
jgi:N6-L-threonylcarbamoyladenine synthase